MKGRTPERFKHYYRIRNAQASGGGCKGLTKRFRRKGESRIKTLPHLLSQNYSLLIENMASRFSSDHLPIVRRGSKIKAEMPMDVKIIMFRVQIMATFFLIIINYYC
jgi:hypothetical protein